MDKAESSPTEPITIFESVGTVGTATSTPQSPPGYFRTDQGAAIQLTEIPSNYRDVMLGQVLTELKHVNDEMKKQNDKITELKKDTMLLRGFRHIPVIATIWNAIFGFLYTTFVK